MFNKLAGLVQEYFGISKKEARGALVLMVLSMLLLWTPFVFRRWVLPLVPVNRRPIDLKKLDSLAVVLEKQNQSKVKTFKPFPKQEYARKIPKRIKLSRFDPNLATVDELETLGVPAFLARRIDKFRSKGGKFRKKEDLLHIYDFPSELFHKLETYINISSSSSNPHSNPFPLVETKSNFKKAPLPGASAPGSVFDLNGADTVQLIGLRGIGSKLALRILKFRDALGGFHSVQQYSEIFGLDSLALRELQRYGRIGSEVKKININVATAEELGRHPYFRDRKKNAVLINYRKQHGAFQSLEDLKKVTVLDDELIKKIGPYLSF